MTGLRQPPAKPPTPEQRISADTAILPAPTSANGASDVSVTPADRASLPANGSRPAASECNDLQQDETDLEGQDLRQLQAAAVRYLLQGARIGTVASSLGISRATLWRWSQTPEWQEAVARERQLLQTAVRAGLQALAAEAVQVLDSALRSQDKRLALSAALAILRGVGALPGRDDGPREA